jgi:outer membrane protein OmpA-like peptidoglycan-associated protein
MIRRRALAVLPLLALPHPGRAQAAPALPAGMTALPEGGVRVIFPRGDATLPAGTAPALAEIGRRLAERPAGFGRITVEGQASGPMEDASIARRLSLARAQAVRSALVAGGLDATRVDVRALGRVAAALDAADVLPPEAPRTPTGNSAGTPAR